MPSGWRAQGVIEPEDAEEMVKAYRTALDEGYHTNKTILTNYKPPYAVNWEPFRGTKWTDPADTGVPMADAESAGARSSPRCPPSSSCIRAWRRSSPTAARWRRASCRSTGAWPRTWLMPRCSRTATRVRLSGQDSGRGTFFHRHAVLHDQNRERWDAGTYIPLQHITENQPDFVVIDSVLSEEAVLGFEYGYATAEPERAGDLGSAVRRFRQRRAGGDRPVHRRG